MEEETINRFKLRMEKKYDTKDHPKKDVLFRLAWEHGHAYGYREVELFYDEFLELIK